MTTSTANKSPDHEVGHQGKDCLPNKDPNGTQAFLEAIRTERANYYRGMSIGELVKEANSIRPNRMRNR